VTSPTAPETRSVTTGLANDTQTEITDGLKEGDQVVTRTISGAATAAAGSSAARTTSTNGRQSGVRIPGMGGF